MKDWENPRLVQRNREKPHAQLVPFVDREGALGGDRVASPFLCLLNGQWRFCYVSRPEYTPEKFEDPAYDWVDQGLLAYSKEGKRYFTYGGDYGDEPNDKQFLINGQVFPDRKPSPGLIGHKAVVQPVQMMLKDLAKGTICVHNENLFLGLDCYDVVWTVMRDAKVQQQGTLAPLAVDPGKSK